MKQLKDKKNENQQFIDNLQYYEKRNSKISKSNNEYQ